MNSTLVENLWQEAADRVRREEYNESRRRWLAAAAVVTAAHAFRRGPELRLAQQRWAAVRNHAAMHLQSGVRRMLRMAKLRDLRRSVRAIAQCMRQYRQRKKWNQLNWAMKIACSFLRDTARFLKTVRTIHAYRRKVVTVQRAVRRWEGVLSARELIVLTEWNALKHAVQKHKHHSKRHKAAGAAAPSAANPDSQPATAGDEAAVPTVPHDGDGHHDRAVAGDAVGDASGATLETSTRDADACIAEFVDQLCRSHSADAAVQPQNVSAQAGDTLRSAPAWMRPMVASAWIHVRSEIVRMHAREFRLRRRPLPPAWPRRLDSSEQLGLAGFVELVLKVVTQSGGFFRCVAVFASSSDLEGNLEQNDEVEVQSLGLHRALRRIRSRSSELVRLRIRGSLLSMAT
jgi:hypothetical protein